MVKAAEELALNEETTAAVHEIAPPREMVKGDKKVDKNTFMWRSRYARYTIVLPLEDGPRTIQFDKNWLILRKSDKLERAVHERLLASPKNGVDFWLEESKTAEQVIEQSADVLERLTKMDVSAIKVRFTPAELAQGGLSQDTEEKYKLMALFVQLGKKL